MSRLIRLWPALALLAASPEFGACGGSSSTVPGASTLPPSSGSESSRPEKTASAANASPHNIDAKPIATTGHATQEGRWWAAARPCPEGSQLWGGPPPEHKEIGCKTDKGVNQGMYTKFHANGKKAEEGEYDKHMATKTWTQWNDGGQKTQETQYEGGSQHGIETEWYPNGRVKSQRQYAHGKRHGLTTIWDEAGHKRSAIEYVEAKQHGSTTYWDEQGHVARVEQWEDGKRLR